MFKECFGDRHFSCFLLPTWLPTLDVLVCDTCPDSGDCAFCENHHTAQHLTRKALSTEYSAGMVLQLSN